MPGTSRRGARGERRGRRSPASGSVMSARSAGGGRTRRRPAGPRHRRRRRRRRRRRPPGSARRSNDGGQVVALDVLGQQVADQDPGLAVLDGLDLRGPGRARRRCPGRQGAADPARPSFVPARPVPVGVSGRARCAQGPQQQEECRRADDRQGDGGEQTQDRHGGGRRSVSAAAEGTTLSARNAPSAARGRRTPTTPTRTASSADRDDDAADQHRLVVLPDVPIANSLSGRGVASTARLPTASSGEVTPLSSAASASETATGRGPGEQARGTAGSSDPTGSHRVGAPGAWRGPAGIPACRSAAAPRMGGGGPRDRWGCPRPLVDAAGDTRGTALGETGIRGRGTNGAAAAGVRGGGPWRRPGAAAGRRRWPAAPTPPRAGASAPRPQTDRRASAPGRAPPRPPRRRRASSHREPGTRPTPSRTRAG